MSTLEPRISVVIPARNAAASLPALLDSLDRQTLPRTQFEVIVVDNGSRDATNVQARRAGAKVAHEPVASRARARNRGATVAGGALLAFIDAECRAEPKWLERLAACLADAPLAGGPVVVDTSALPGRVERFEVLWRFQQQRHVEENGWSASANLGIRADVFAALAGFDPGYTHIGEDVDLCLRAGLAGHRIAWCPDAVVHHPAETSLRAVWARARRQGFAAEQHHRRTDGRYGRRDWRHPGPLLRGDFALRRLGVDPTALEPKQRRTMLALARFEYAGRMLGGVTAARR